MNGSRVSVGLAALPTADHVLYRFYDRTDVLLYIGVTMDFPSRMASHKRRKPWWTEVARIEMEPFESRAAVLAAEKHAIENEKPLYNDQHNRTVAAPTGSRDVMDTVLRMLTSDPEVYADALAKAAKRYPEESVEYRATRDVTTYAVECVASGMSSDLFRLADCLERLFAQLPVEMIETCRAQAAAYNTELDDEFGTETSPAELLADTATKVEFELARAYLDTLPEAEAADWRLLIANQTRGAPDAIYAIYVVRLAAAYARQYKAGRRFIQSHMCLGPGSNGTPCTLRASHLVRFDEKCAEECPSDCLGHARFCDVHVEEAKAGQLVRGGEPTPAVLGVVAIDGREEEAPF